MISHCLKLYNFWHFFRIRILDLKLKICSDRGEGNKRGCLVFMKQEIQCILQDWERFGIYNR